MPPRPKDAAAARETAERLASALRTRRFDQQLTQGQLADRLDISIEAYARLERGQSLPSFETLLRICTTLGTTPDALLLANAATTPQAENGRNRPRIRPSRAPANSVVVLPVESPRRSPLAIRNPPLPDEPDEPPGLAPQGRIRLGAREQERLDLTIELLRRLDRSDRAVVYGMVQQLARRTGVLPPVPEDSGRR